MAKKMTVALPDIGEGVVEGEVVQWLKKIGDSVGQDEPVVIVMTDKATVELPAPKPGILIEAHIEEGKLAHKGRPLYTLQVEGEESEPALDAKTEENKTISLKKPVILEKKRSCSPCNLSSTNPLAAPKTRKLAKEMGIDLHLVTPTGASGEVTPEDLKQFVESKESKKAASIVPMEGDKVVKITGIPLLMARQMSLSKNTIPHFSYFEQADVEKLEVLKNNIKEKAIIEGVSLTYMPFFIRALSLTMKKFPLLNAAVDTAKDEIIYREKQNIGVAMTTQLGLIVPVLPDVQKMSLKEIILGFDSLKKRAKEHKLKPSEMQNGTITLSNFGVLKGGGLFATPVINPPETAILALGRIQMQPAVRNGKVEARLILNCCWSFDHRVIDGDLAANIASTFSEYLQNPLLLT